MSASEFPERIVFSRKGFDSAAGGCASPILDGRLISLPIPEPSCRPRACHPGHVRYRELGEAAPGVPLARLVSSLTRGKVRGGMCAHLDPDLRCELRAPRHQQAKPLLLFGQCGNAQSELRDAAPGDLFLFFGWFRAAERFGRGFRFVPGAPDEHHLWGWLQVGSLASVPTLERGRMLDPRTHHHPHVAYADRWANNVLYQAAERLSFAPKMLGAGVFEHASARTRLTEPGARSRSCWRLPAFFADAGTTRFTFAPELWRRERDTVVSVAPRAKGCGAASYGQEFVTHTADVRKQAATWLSRLFEDKLGAKADSTAA